MTLPKAWLVIQECNIIKENNSCLWRTYPGANKWRNSIKASCNHGSLVATKIKSAHE